MSTRETSAPFPHGLLVPTVVALAVLILPLAALASRVDPATLWADVASPETLRALALSLATAAIATIACLVVGVPLAVAIARARPAVAAVMRVLVAVPLVLPPLVGGVALLSLFDDSTLAGALLIASGLRVPATAAAVVIAQIFVALPFLVLVVEASLRATDIAHERAAASLGAGRWTILWRVTLPLARGGLVSGLALCFARAVGEFGATAIFAGSAPGGSQTMPLAIYAAFTGSGAGEGAAVALALLLLAIVVVALIAARAWRPGSAR